MLGKVERFTLAEFVDQSHHSIVKTRPIKARERNSIEQHQRGSGSPYHCNITPGYTILYNKVVNIFRSPPPPRSKNASARTTNPYVSGITYLYTRCRRENEITCQLPSLIGYILTVSRARRPRESIRQIDLSGKGQGRVEWTGPK